MYTELWRGSLEMGLLQSLRKRWESNIKTGFQRKGSKGDRMRSVV
jgi:hypothetical protein